MVSLEVQTLLRKYLINKMRKNNKRSIFFSNHLSIIKARCFIVCVYPYVSGIKNANSKRVNMPIRIAKFFWTTTVHVRSYVNLARQNFDMQNLSFGEGLLYLRNNAHTQKYMYIKYWMKIFTTSCNINKCQLQFVICSLEKINKRIKLNYKYFYLTST